MRLRARRPRERLLGALANTRIPPPHPLTPGTVVTGALLVGGASKRFGSPKALAPFGGTILAEHAHALLAQAFGKVIVVGKSADALPLPFEVLDDGSETRAAIVGVAAALRFAPSERCVVLPTDMPYVTTRLLHVLARAAEEVDAVVPQTGPLPGAFNRSCLPVLERRIAADELALRDAV
ncbi:MAG: molybdenum cofactor guanylyltransferase, partial [Gaiellaceae bacterium]